MSTTSSTLYFVMSSVPGKSLLDAGTCTCSRLLECAIAITCAWILHFDVHSILHVCLHMHSFTCRWAAVVCDSAHVPRMWFRQRRPAEPWIVHVNENKSGHESFLILPAEAWNFFAAHVRACLLLLAQRGGLSNLTNVRLQTNSKMTPPKCLFTYMSHGTTMHFFFYHIVFWMFTLCFANFSRVFRSHAQASTFSVALFFRSHNVKQISSVTFSVTLCFGCSHCVLQAS